MWVSRYELSGRLSGVASSRPSLPRLPPFTDTPHPPSLICWASHELAGVGMIGRCVTAQPACAYALRSTWVWVWVGTQHAAQAGTQQCPAAGTAWAGGQCSASVLCCLLASGIQVREVPNYFFSGSLAVAVGSAAFFVSFSFPSLLSIPNNPVHSFPTRCRRYHPAATYRPYGLSAFCLCSPRIPRAPSSGRDRNNPAISAASSVT